MLLLQFANQLILLEQSVFIDIYLLLEHLYLLLVCVGFHFFLMRIMSAVIEALL